MKTLTLVLAVLLTGTAHAGSAMHSPSVVEKIATIEQAADPDYLTLDQLLAEWASANSDTKKWQVFENFLKAEAAKEKVKKAAKEKVKKAAKDKADKEKDK